jgi:hypothetical protein
MTDAIGGGTSRVTIENTEVRDGVPVTTVREVSEYVVNASRSPLRRLWARWTAGDVARGSPALYTMAVRHGELLDAGHALAGAINDSRRKWPGFAIAPAR